MDTKTLVDVANQSGFWQATFLGWVGTIAGAVSLVIGWLNYRYNRPKIEIEEATLIIPQFIKKDWKNKTIEQLKNNYLELNLEIVIRNTRGGSGSISKPLLLVKYLSGRRFYFLKKYKEIRLQPVTQHFEAEKTGENSFKTWTERHGRSFNLSGGEKVDDRLQYSSSNPRTIQEFVNSIDSSLYFLEFRNNSGKIQRKKIKDIEEDNY